MFSSLKEIPDLCHLETPFLDCLMRYAFLTAQPTVLVVHFHPWGSGAGIGQGNENPQRGTVRYLHPWAPRYFLSEIGLVKDVLWDPK